MPRYKRHHPELIDPAGVQPGIEARPMGTTSDSSRAETVQATGGLPLAPRPKSLAPTSTAMLPCGCLLSPIS